MRICALSFPPSCFDEQGAQWKAGERRQRQRAVGAAAVGHDDVDTVGQRRHVVELPAHALAFVDDEHGDAVAVALWTEDVPVVRRHALSCGNDHLGALAMTAVDDVLAVVAQQHGARLLLANIVRRTIAQPARQPANVFADHGDHRRRARRTD